MLFKLAEGEQMKIATFSAQIVIALFVGIALGIFLARPPKVKAMGSPYYVYVQRVQEGNNIKSALGGSRIIGFSCTAQDCFIATTE